MVASWTAANCPDLHSMQDSAWKLKGDERYIKLEMGKEYPTIMDDIKKKKHADLPVSVVEYVAAPSHSSSAHHSCTRYSALAARLRCIVPRYEHDSRLMKADSRNLFTSAYGVDL